MKKFSILLVIIFSFCALTLYAQEAPEIEAEIEEEETSYGLIGIRYNMGFFGQGPRRLTSSAGANLGISAKIPFTTAFGIELGLQGLTVPINMAGAMTFGTNIVTGTVKGAMSFTEIDFNVIYYMWFLKTMQLKMGLSYLEFSDSNVALDGNNVGWDEDWYLPDNNFLFTLGLAIDLPLFEQFYLMSGIGFKLFFDTTYGSIITIDIGLGYKF